MYFIKSTLVIESNMQYTEVKEIRSDLHIEEDSFILEKLLQHFPNLESYKQQIFELLQAIVLNQQIYKPISYVMFDESKQNRPSMLCDTYCFLFVFQHLQI